MAIVAIAIFLCLWFIEATIKKAMLSIFPLEYQSGKNLIFILPNDWFQCRSYFVIWLNTEIRVNYSFFSIVLIK